MDMVMDTIILKLSITITSIRKLCIRLIMDIKVIMGVILVATTEAMAKDITEDTTEVIIGVTTEVTWSLGHLVTWSLSHLVTWSLSHLVT